MQGIVFEILITVLILSLILLIIIPIYKQFNESLLLVLKGGEQKGLEEEIFSYEQDKDFYGYEIISQIDYFKQDEEFEIEVLNDYGNFVYTDNSYNREEFSINYHDKYYVSDGEFKNGHVEYTKRNN